jgi:hypothetical protein
VRSVTAISGTHREPNILHVGYGCSGRTTIASYTLGMNTESGPQGCGSVGGLPYPSGRSGV